MLSLKPPNKMIHIDQVSPDCPEACSCHFYHFAAGDDDDECSVTSLTEVVRHP